MRRSGIRRREAAQLLLAPALLPTQFHARAWVDQDLKKQMGFA